MHDKKNCLLYSRECPTKGDNNITERLKEIQKLLKGHSIEVRDDSYIKKKIRFEILDSKTHQVNSPKGAVTRFLNYNN